MELLPTQQILDFWFNLKNKNNAFWFDKSCDVYIYDHYKHLVDNINSDNYIKYINNNDDMIALLLIGDQFTRNIYRDEFDSNNKKNDIWALKLALNCIENNIDLQYPLHYRFFIYLPLRHSNQSKLLDIVRSRIKLYNNQNIEMKKFYKYTIHNYTHLTDTIKTNHNYIDSIYNYDSILEKYERSDNFNINIYKTCKYKRIGLSLSGGVDSMVLFHVLKHNNIDFVAIHLEYVNRPEAKLEREFLEYYCTKMNVKLYYRTIDYISRNDDRELYEKATRDARFALYKYVIDKDNLEGICLGHHSGDIVENVFTNIIKNKNNICGMEYKQCENNIICYRPFLNFTKNDILKVAHYHSIPYFLNSTPVWSCRGVLRDQVIPILKKQFGDFENNIIEFTKLFTKYQNYYKCTINIIELEYYIKVEYYQDINIDEILLKITHNKGYKMISHKLKNNFILWLKGNKQNQIDLGKDIFCYYKFNYLYFVNYTKIIKDKICFDKLFIMFDKYLPPKLKCLF
jgi:tRNA(Ile)-lysidine synthetase-like protein